MERIGAAAVGVGAVGALRYWLLACRPRTLGIATVPVLVGSLLGRVQAGTLAVDLMLVALAAALLIQVGTNLHNDAADFARGADDPATRLGPPRASAQGWLPASAIVRAARACFLASGVLGLFLVWAGGWPILLVGLASIAAGWGYSGGPRPIAYTPLGELFVFVFFGLIAVSGSCFLQTGSVGLPALLAGAAVGMPAAAVLVVNNLRDRVADRLAGRRTVAVLLGVRASCIEYACLLLLPFALLAAFAALLPLGPLGWLPWLLLPWALLLVRRLWRQPAGVALNALLADTARLQAGLGVALCVALWRAVTGA